jgi:hypothetical protein
MKEEGNNNMKIDLGIRFDEIMQKQPEVESQEEEEDGSQIPD